MAIHIGAPMTEQAVSHRLFGCNMEITRRAFWQGISAQMAANRKFYVPDGWQTQGDTATRHRNGSLCVTLVNRGREAVTLCVQGLDGAQYRVWKPLSVDTEQTGATEETGMLHGNEATLPTGAVMLLICG